MNHNIQGIQTFVWYLNMNLKAPLLQWLALINAESEKNSLKEFIENIKYLQN